MQRVGTGRRSTSPRAWFVGAAAGAAVLTLTLSACTSNDGNGSKSPAAQNDPLSTPASSSAAAGASSSSSSSSTPAEQPAVITTSATGVISPIRPVTVGIQNGKLTDVTMVNPAGRKVHGELAADGASWRNTEVLGYSKTYTITAKGVGDGGQPVTKTTEVKTLTPGNMTMPYIDTIYGSGIQNGGTYGVGMIVKVHFDEQVDKAKAQRALQVTTTPDVTGGWYWETDQDAYWRPEQYYQPGTQVTVKAKVYGVQVGPGLYGQADQSVSFKIGQKRVSVADAKTHQVKVYFDDKLVRTMATSMGQGGTVQGKYGPIYLWTMPGTYTVINHENPATMSSDSYGLPANSPLGYAPEKVPYATKISIDGIYLHELDTTVWAQGHQNVSHGCLNLNYKNAKWYYEHSQVGDVVKVIHSGGPHIQFWQGGQWDVPWSEWLKHSAL
jgi:lipoprotein-anchoring transpeptidase ErfK/SrfK